jgi:hypothetical protein
MWMYSSKKMQRSANDRHLTNRNDATVVAANRDVILTGSWINPEFYSWKKHTQIRTRNLIMSLKSPHAASRRHRAHDNSAPGYCNVKGVPSAFLGISVLCVWSLATIGLVNYRLLAANSNTSIAGSTREWVEEFDLTFIGLSLPVVKQEALPKIRIPRKLKGRAKVAAERIDFGGLDIDPLPESGARRRIKKDPRLTMTEFRDPDAPRDDDSDIYYLADDDYSKLKYGSADGDNDDDDDSKMKEGDGCRFVSDYHLNFQNCNRFHETPLEESNLKYLG